METAQLTADKILANEKEVTELNSEYTTLAEQTKLTPTPTPVRTPPGSVQGDAEVDEDSPMEMGNPDGNSEGQDNSMGDESGTRPDDEMAVDASTPNTITHTARTTQNGKKRCVPLPTLETLNASFGQYDHEELAMFRQKLDEHFREAETARSVELDMSALLSGDTGAGFEPTQVG